VSLIQLESRCACVCAGVCWCAIYCILMSVAAQGHAHSCPWVLVVVAFCGAVTAVASSQGPGEESLGHCLFGNTLDFANCTCCYKGHGCHLGRYVMLNLNVGVHGSNT
jgi:hypothetical protein